MKKQTYFVNLMQNRGNAWTNITQILKMDDGTYYLNAAKLLTKNAILNKGICEKFFPKTALCNYPFYLDDINVWKIILWYASILNVYANVIKTFEMQKKQFESFFLLGQYDKAYEICVENEHQFGISLWLLDAYGLLETYASPNTITIQFDSQTQSTYDILKIKNIQTERQPQFIKRIDHLLLDSGIDQAASTYYKYKLFAEMPLDASSQDEIANKWRDILLIEGGYSIFDIYLVTLDCVQYYVFSEQPKTNMAYMTRIIDVLSGIDTELCHLAVSSFNDTIVDEQGCAGTLEYLDLFQSGNHSEICSRFFQGDFDNVTSFTAYKYAAISAIHLSNINYDSSTSAGYYIFDNLHNILQKEDEESINTSFQQLCIISRILRSFRLHKGLCVFLKLEFATGVKYCFGQQLCSFDDSILLKYEFESEDPKLLPYRLLYSSIDDKEYCNAKNILERRVLDSCAPDYYEAALARINLANYVSKGEISGAIAVFVNSYIKNKFYVTSINIKEIREYLRSALNDEETLSLEELCFVFIDAYFGEYRISCFRNFLDDIQVTMPLEIVTNSVYDKKISNYFLDRICSVDMLIELYEAFNSSDEATDYRIKICDYLLQENYKNKVYIKHEFEKLTKEKALLKRLITVDRSRVSINSAAIKASTYDDIEFQIDACIAMTSEKILAKAKEPMVAWFPKLDTYLYMYGLYAEKFCFSQYGLDTSLSTRVRHGLFTNQIFKLFVESNLIYEHGRNDYIDDLITTGKADPSIISILTHFENEIQAKLQYFTRQTLKVFIDEPIEGAVFDYSIKTLKEELLKSPPFLGLVLGKKQNAQNTIEHFHNLISQKTDEYLKLIRNQYLLELQESLATLLDELSNNGAACIKVNIARSAFRRKIAQCKTNLQNEFANLEKWFYLSENEVWENFNYDDLLDICFEITKKLFSNFEKVQISKNINIDLEYNGIVFRNFTDIVLILLNNAFSHSGYEYYPSELKISCNQYEDDQHIYLEIENNIHPSIDVIGLQEKINRINQNYSNQVFKSLNTRQEGGMGLLKIMSILYEISNSNDSFYMSMNGHIVKVRIKLRKDLRFNEKNIVC